MEKGAIINKGYRYRLWRIWGNPKNVILFIGLNPSRANAFEDDPTIRKLIRITKKMGYGGFYIVNLFGYITPEPKDLLKVTDPVGPGIDLHIASLISKAKRIVCMWGSKDIPGIKERIFLIKKMIKEHKATGLSCFQVNKDGNPTHPLYLPETNLCLKEYSWVG